MTENTPYIRLTYDLLIEWLENPLFPYSSGPGRWNPKTREPDCGCALTNIFWRLGKINFRQFRAEHIEKYRGNDHPMTILYTGTKNGRHLSEDLDVYEWLYGELSDLGLDIRSLWKLSDRGPGSFILVIAYIRSVQSLEEAGA